jgi:hypothetical protein
MLEGEGSTRMDLSSVDQAFWLAGFVGELILLALLVLKRQFYVYPFLLLWMAISAACDPFLYWLSIHAVPRHYQLGYLVASFLDYSLEVGVLVEIAYRALRPDKNGIPRKVLRGLLGALFLLFACLTAWTLGSWGRPEAISAMAGRVVQVDLGFAFLRMTLFALIAGFSQMLGITWRSHVLRLAAGLAFYSACSLVIQMAISHLPTGDRNQYLAYMAVLQRVQVTAYLATLSFWVWSFVQKDAPRKEFTPQMQRFLVTITEGAKRGRMVLARSEGQE